MKWGESADGKIEYTTMTPKDVTEGLDIIHVVFFRDECVAIACDLINNEEACRELEELCLEAASDGVSIIAREKSTNKIAGVMYNKIQVKNKPGEQNYFEKYRDTKCKEKNSIGQMNFMIYVDSQVDSFAHYNANCSLELMFLATHPDFRRCGVATDLVKHSVALAKSLSHSEPGNVPQMCSLIASAVGTYKAALKSGFEVLCRVKWTDVEYEGVKYDKKIDHNMASSDAILMARPL